MPLSEQQLVDCCPHAPDGGGNVNTAFNYIKTCGGIEPEELYPYEGKVSASRKTGKFISILTRPLISISING